MPAFLDVFKGNVLFGFSSSGVLPFLTFKIRENVAISFPVVCLTGKKNQPSILQRYDYSQINTL